MPNKYLSLSHILSPTLSCYNNRYAIKVFPYKQREKTVIFEGHTGTHVDVPYHVDETGKKITDYQLEDFIFSQVYMVAVTVRGNYVEAQDVSCVPENTDFLIINTGYSRDRAADKYALQNVGVSPEAIAVLRQKCKSLRAIGIDSMSFNAYQDKERGRMAHKACLLQKPEILIVEDMNLSAMSENIKINKLFVVPMVVAECDGAVCSVIAEVSDAI